MSDALTSSADHLGHESFALIMKAIREGWDIRPDVKAKLPSIAIAIACDKNKPDKARLRALQVLVQMDRANASDRMDAAKVELGRESNAIARDGIGPNLADLIGDDPAAQDAAVALAERLLAREQARIEAGSDGTNRP